MNYKIDSNILNETTECRANFSCLFGKKDCFCEVEYDVKSNGRVIFIKPVENVTCDYILPFGKSWTCTCPTRQAIYECYRT
jgi:hypothetical protein